MKNYLYCIGAIVLIIAIFYLIIGCINTNSDVIISKDSESILVKEYKWNNSDSCIYEYPADKIYPGIIINKYKYFRYAGIPGKGGHISTSYYITILYNNNEHKIRNYNLYHKYNKNDQVTVKEIWYPHHDIIIY